MIKILHSGLARISLWMGHQYCNLALFFAILLLSWAANAAPDTAKPDLRTQWQKAIQAYQAKDFAAAREHFEKILATGKTHADLYYNLGNTLFQLGERGRAAWMFEKALQANPRHSQARSNLLLIRDTNQNQRNPGYLGFLVAPFSWISRQCSANGWFVAACLLYTLSCVLLSVWLINRKHQRRNALRTAWIASLIATAITGLFAAHEIAALEQHAFGVVIEKGAIVRSAPGADEPEYFPAQEGERLEVHSAGVRGWTRVKNPADGKVGYLPENAILIL